MSRTGRRPGTPETRDAILIVARRRFAVRGYDATSLRDIASEADVDPALILHYFRTKEALFAAATGLPDGISELLGGLTALPLQDFTRALVRAYLDLIDSDDSRNAVLALVRSAVSNDNAAATLREFLSAQLLPAIERLTSHPDAPLRASLVAAQLIGIATQRHVIRLEPLVRATPAEITTLVAPAIEQYLRLSGRSHAEYRCTCSLQKYSFENYTFAKWVHRPAEARWQSSLGVSSTGSVSGPD